MQIAYDRELLTAVLDGTIDAALLSGDDGQYFDANLAACALFGMTREELLQRKATDFSPGDGVSAYEVWRSFLARGRLSGELVFTRPDGEQRNLVVSATANVVPGVHLSVLRDVTAQRRTEAQLRESQARLESAQSLAQLGSWVVDADGNGARSAEHARICGVPPDGACSREQYLGSVHPDDREEARRKLAEAFEGGGKYEHEYRVVRPSGEMRWVHSHLVGERATNGKPARVVGALQDVTDRRALVEGLRASEHRYRRLIDAISEGVLLVAPDGRITVANAQIATLLGCSLDDVIGHSAFEFIEENEHKIARERLLRRQRGVGDEYTSHLKRRDGSTVSVAVRVDPLVDADGNLEGLVSVVRDLSEQRAAEAMKSRLSDTEEQLRHSQKMEAIGVLAGGVAHDFNNLLSIVLSYTGLLRDGMSEDDPKREDLEEISRAAQRAAALTRQLLAFSRRQVLQPRTLDMREILRGMEKMLRRLLGEDIALSLLTPDALGLVHVDPGQLEQVIMNIAVNARDAMAQGGSLSIEVSDVDVGAAAAPRLCVDPGRYVRVTVSDTGSGMDAATRARIFEPFFTTKQEGRGTGLGLSTVFGIVKQSGGHVTVESDVGRGTTFHVYLPRSESSAPAVSEAQGTPTSLEGDETILVAEDDEQVRRVIATTLRRRGYRILESGNAGEAMIIAERDDQPIHLLLTDVVMPRVSGRELAERIVKARPEVKVLFMSGYTADAVLRHGVEERSVSFLSKPFTPALLSRKVREVLDAGAGTPSRRGVAAGEEAAQRR